MEKRCCSIWKIPENTGTESWHNDFKILIQIHRKVERFNTRKKRWETSTEDAYYLSDHELTAEEANIIVRQLWSVENRLHYVRDTAFGEDASRIIVNPCIFGLLRSFAFNLLRFNKIKNIGLALYDNALSFDRVLEYKGI